MAHERSAAPELAAPLVSPTVEEWRALTPAERERFVVRVLDAPGTADLIGRLQTMVEELSVKADQAVQAIEALRAGLLALLAARGLAVTDEARDRVTLCDDPAMLQRWLLRAVSAASVEDVLAGEQGPG